MYYISYLILYIIKKINFDLDNEKKNKNEFRKSYNLRTKLLNLHTFIKNFIYIQIYLINYTKKKIL